jgi:hypothetical protein
MITHQHIGIEEELVTGFVLFEADKIPRSIGVIAKDISAVIAASDDVMESAGILNAGLARHDSAGL